MYTFSLYSFLCIRENVYTQGHLRGSWPAGLFPQPLPHVTAPRRCSARPAPLPGLISGPAGPALLGTTRLHLAHAETGARTLPAPAEITLAAPGYALPPPAGLAPPAPAPYAPTLLPRRLQAWQALATAEAALAESQEADGISSLEAPTNADLELVDGFIA